MKRQWYVRDEDNLKYEDKERTMAFKGPGQ